MVTKTDEQLEREWREALLAAGLPIPEEPPPRTSLATFKEALEDSKETPQNTVDQCGRVMLSTRNMEGE